jgi:hypothetical protein
MVRMVLSNLMGSHLPPDPDSIVRSVGEPGDGICTLEDGSLAFL